jgi:hypothetical protein
MSITIDLERPALVCFSPEFSKAASGKKGYSSPFEEQPMSLEELTKRQSRREKSRTDFTHALNQSRDFGVSEDAIELAKKMADMSVNRTVGIMIYPYVSLSEGKSIVLFWDDYENFHAQIEISENLEVDFFARNHKEGTYWPTDDIEFSHSNGIPEKFHAYLNQLRVDR